jgi:hypothetical protein
MTVQAAVNVKDIADAKRKAQALRARVAGRRSNAKVEVDAGTLKAILKVVDAVALKVPDRGSVARQAKATASLMVTEEISPQEAAEILQMSRPSVMRLIAQGHLHPRKIQSRNKLLRAEVMNFQIEQSRQQRQALSNLVALVEDHDF